MTLDASTAAETALQALRSWLALVTGYALTAIVVEPYDGDRLARPYIGVSYLTPGVQRGHDYVNTTNTASGSLYVNTITGHRTGTYFVTVYGDDCDQLVERIRMGRTNRLAARAARTAGIAIVRTLDLRTARQLLDTEHELRAKIDLVVAYAVQTTFVDAVVETVEPTFTLE